MPKFIRLLLTALCLTALCLTLNACRGGQPAAVETPDDPQALLKTAVENMQVADSFRMIIEQRGQPYPLRLSLDGISMITAKLQRAAAQFISPSELYIQVKLDMGITAMVDVFSLDDQQWIRLASGAPWLPFSVGETFDISRLMTDGDGLEYAMTHLTSPQILGQVALIDGAETTRIQATAAAETVASLLLGLLEPSGDVQMDAYIRTDSQHIALIEITLLEDGGDDPTVWRIEFYDYSAPRDFDRPPQAAAQEDG